GNVRTHLTGALAAAGVLAMAVASFAGTDLNASWSNGLSLQSEDKSFKLKIGGRIMNDWAWFAQDDSNEVYYGNIQDGTEFRRARIALSGTVYQYVLFKAELDFAGAAKAGKEVAMKDVYMGITSIPLAGTIQMGHQKEPFGLEVMTSSNQTTFMERAVTNVFAPERNTGIRLQNAFIEEKLTFTAGVFRETDDGGRNSGDGDYAVTARLTAMPWANEEKGGLLHIGGAYSQRNPSGDVAYESRPSAHLAPDFVGVDGTVDAVSLFGGEGAFCYGPFRAQGEYMMSTIDAEEAGDPSFMSYYAYASALITGERYKYKKSEAVFEPVEPKTNFRQDGTGAGAWEIGVRFAFLDLNDQDIYGGEMTDITVGLNWYMAPTARIMFNYVNSSVENIGTEGTDAGSVNVFETRFHIFF
ncbi:porin, partial [Candidatus Uhrbacteria bacterium]|nr:porin [Candidatus Uhrbacteria bacterium]